MREFKTEMTATTASFIAMAVAALLLWFVFGNGVPLDDHPTNWSAQFWTQQ